MERGTDDPRATSKRAWWQRKRVLIPAGLLALVILVSALSDPSKKPADGAALHAGASSPQAGGAAPSQTATPAATADPVKRARSRGRQLARRGEYATAAAVYAAVGLHREAARVRRAGARKLLHSARAALTGGRYRTARRLALRSRRLRSTRSAGSVLHSVDVAVAEAARAARLARDRKTCTSAEKAAVRSGGGVPLGCTTYAARRAEKLQAQASAQSKASTCDPNYTGACLKPDSPDYDCEGGSGDGPDYTGPVDVVGDDHYGLDADGDGTACTS